MPRMTRLLRFVLAGLLMSVAFARNATAEWTDISAQVTANRGGQVLDFAHRVYWSNFSITNTGSEPIAGPVRVVITDSNPPVSSTYGAPDGVTASDGKPYYLLAAGDGAGLAPGATSKPEKVFFQLQRARLSYQVRVEQDIDLAAPGLGLSTTALDFGDVLAGGSDSQQFTISNTGDADLVVSDIQLTGVGFELFPPLSFTLAPDDAAVPVSVGFSPDGATGFSGTATVVSNAGNAQITLSGTGLASVDPGDITVVDTVDFGLVEEGVTAQRDLSITNDGAGLLRLTGASTDDAAFTVAPSAADSFPMTLAPGESRVLDLGFTAPAGSAGSTLTATLTFDSDDPDESPFDVALTAQGLDPASAPATVPVSSARVRINPFDLITADSCSAVAGEVAFTENAQSGDAFTVTLTDSGFGSNDGGTHQVISGQFQVSPAGTGTFSGIAACALGDGIIDVKLTYYRSGAVLGTYQGTPAVKHTTALGQPVLDPLPVVTSDGTIAVCGSADPGVSVRIEGGAAMASVQLGGTETDFCIDVPLRRNTQNTLIATAVDVNAATDPKPTASAAPVQIVHVDPTEVVVAQASSRPLTTEEVETLVDNGVIDLDDPSNFHVSMFTVVLTIGADPASPPVTYSQPVPIPINPGGSGGSGPSGGGVYYGSAGPGYGSGGGGCTSNCGQVFVMPTPTGETIPGVIIIDGRIKTLKEFFQITIAIDNTASSFALTDVIARILTPSGLTTISNALGSSIDDVPPPSQVADVEQIELGRIEPAGSGVGQFIVRGDSAGDYDVTIEFDGFIAEGGIPTPIPFNGSASTSLRVYGPPELGVVVRHPSHLPGVDPANPLGFDVQAGEIYDLIVEITNESPRPALYTSLDLFIGGDSQLVDASGNPVAGSHEVKSFGHIQPGQTVSAAFRVQSLAQGEIIACQAIASENINLSVDTGPDGDGCTVANTYPASFEPLPADQPPAVIGISPLNGANNADISTSPFVTLTPQSACIVGDTFKNVLTEERTNSEGHVYQHVVGWTLDQPGTFYIEELDAAGVSQGHIPTDLTVVDPAAGGTTIATLRLGLDSPWPNSQYFLKANTTYRVTLKGGTGGVCSATSGAEMASDFVWTFSTAQTCGGTAPIATLVEPVDGSIDNALNQRVVVEFSNRMNPASFAFVPGNLAASTFGVYENPAISSGALTTEGSVIPGNAVFSDFNRRLTYTPSINLLEDAEIVVRLTDGLADTCGEPLQTPPVGEQLFSFQTQPPDTTPPASPVVNAVPALTKNASITVSGESEPSSIVTISGGAATVTATASSTGQFSVVVPLQANQSNSLVVQAEDASGNLSGAVGSDRNGDPLTVVQDSTPPAPVTILPADGATDVPRNTAVDVVLDSELDPASVNATNVVLEGSVIPGSLTLNASSTGFTFTPADPLDYNTTYTLRLRAGGIKDLAGNGLPSEIVSTFTTESLPAPTVTGVTPNQGLRGTSFSVTFSGTNLATASAVVSPNSGVSGVVDSASDTSVTATITIAADATLGGTTLGLVTGGGSASTAFTVNAAPPVISDVSPNFGYPGQTVDVTVTGTGLTDAWVSINGGNLSLTKLGGTANQVVVRVEIELIATMTDRVLTVTTTGGSDTAVFSVKQPPPPVLDSLTPTEAVQGQSVPVTFQGQHLATAGAVVSDNSGISGTITSVTDTEVTATVTVQASATVGATTLGLGTVGGQATLAFTVLPPAPTVATLSPDSGLQGETLTVTVTGTDLATAGAVISDNPGISGSVLGATATTATLELVIDPLAATGATQVGVTTAGGSAQGAFTVLHKAPAISALVPGGGIPGSIVDAVIQGSGLSDITGINIDGEWVSVSLLSGTLVEVVPVSYSFDKSTDCGTYCYYDYGGTQLTDGDYGIKPWNANLGNGPAYEWVGWQSPDSTINIDFDFGATTQVDEIHVGTTQDYPGDVVLPDVDIFASADGVSWTLLDGVVVPESTDNNDSYRTYVLSGLDASARYYRVQARHNVDGPWTFIDEVDFYQGAGGGSDAAQNVRFTINASATLGSRNVTVFTPGGSATVGFQVVTPPNPAVVDPITPIRTNASSILVSGDADPNAVIAILDGRDGVETTGDADGSGSFAITVPLVAEGDHDLTVTASNAFGNSASPVTTDSGGAPLTVYRDLTAPAVASVDPADAAVDIALDATVTVDFSEAIDPASVSSGTTFLLEGSIVPGSVVIAGDNLSLTFTPDAPLDPAKTYTVRIPTGGITDTAGNGFATQFTSSFTTTTELPVDLNTWGQESVPSNGNWSVSTDGQTVLQSINGNPTVFISPEPVIDQVVTGKLKVETTSDDDFIGFVFGYQAPIAANGDSDNDFDFWLFDWKQANQSPALEGFALSRARGTITDYGAFWNHPTTAGAAFETVATDYSTSLGWNDNTEYNFSLEYRTDLIEISIQSDSDSRFSTPYVVFSLTPEDVFGAGTDRGFINGAFGFYNYSQASVRYTGFVQNVTAPPPAPTVTGIDTGGAPGTTVTATVTGTDLATVHRVTSTNPEITARILSVAADGSDAVLEISIGAGAGTGQWPLTLETLGGSAQVDFTVDVAPSLTAVTPADGFQDQTLIVTFEGTGLGFAEQVTSSNPGISATITSQSDTLVEAAVTIAPDAAVGVTDIGLQTPVGSASLPFEVYAATPVELLDFSDLSALTLNGSAASPISNPVFYGGQDVLRLTNDLNQGGSAFLTDTINLEVGGLPTSFSTAFQFQITDPQGITDTDGAGADGIVFIVQTQANNVGGTGAGIGYDGVSPSVAVEFDTFYNSGTDDTGNEVGISLDGNLNSVVKAPVTTRMNNGAVWYAWVDYDGDAGQLEVRLSETPTRPATALATYGLDLPAQLGQSAAYVGFTSGTGSASGDHDIRAWKLRNTYAPFGDW